MNLRNSANLPYTGQFFDCCLQPRSPINPLIRGVELVTLIRVGNLLALVPLDGREQSAYHSKPLCKMQPSTKTFTCSCTQPSTQRHRSVVEYRAYDMLVLASKHQAELASVLILLPLQNSVQMVCGPLL